MEGKGFWRGRGVEGEEVTSQVEPLSNLASNHTICFIRRFTKVGCTHGSNHQQKFSYYHLLPSHHGKVVGWHIQRLDIQRPDMIRMVTIFN